MGPDAEVKGKASACDLGSTLEVEDPESCPYVPMGLSVIFEVRGCPHLFDKCIVGGILAERNRGMRYVRNFEQDLVEHFLVRRQLLFEHFYFG